MAKRSNDKNTSADILKSVHKNVSGLNRIGLVDKKTLREFDEMCLPKIQLMNGSDIKALRERLNLSQPVFAMYLNTSKSTVSKWEQGDKIPNGIAQRLLNIIDDKGLEVLV
ncbi:MAG: DNA-binding transcriptional regulator [Halioglobus sp.]